MSTAGASAQRLVVSRETKDIALHQWPDFDHGVLQGQLGTLQARPGKAVTQGDVQRQSLRSGGWCPLEPQFQLVYAFDTLTGNEGRTAETLLFDAEEWFAYAVGYDKAFGTGKGLPAYLKARPPAPGTELRKRLKALDVAGLRA